MAIDRILKFFQPKDRTFIPLLEKATENIVTIADCLLQVVRESDLHKREDLIRKVEELEHQGDEITHEVLSHLNTIFITPFDREDIHALITSIDDVADHVKDAALRIRLFKPATLPPSIIKMSELICNGTVEVKKAIKELGDVRNLGKLKKLIIDINNVENQADAIFELAMSDLFENEKDPIEIIKIKDIIAKMESATDRCEDIANVIESIIVKTT
jgi:predicted phosphate transport protein (TIGR00153 family)